MKIIYSELKKLLPNLSADSKQLRNDLTLIGHFVSGYEEIENEQVLDLEIRQNRADCLGYFGVAKELSVFYSIPLKIENHINSLANLEKKSNINIEIKSSDVKRILALKISNIKVCNSPQWLVKFLKLHDINSINNLVDITNYIMILYGIPCHAFDTAKSTDHLTWENNNNKYKNFTTLDGTVLKLNPETLIISNPSNVLSLGFIGGQNSGIDSNTTETLIEMAIYNPTRIRKDSRQLKTITEASIRLDKFLDTELIPQAFSHLTSKIIEMCGGQISSNLFENYSQKPEKIEIEFDPKKPSLYAGIDIPQDFAIDCLIRLGCEKSPLSKGDLEGFVPPSIRKDISLEEDLIEEVIRFYGYNKIPTNEPISSEIFSDITPPILYLIEKLKDELISLGYDEIRSWPLIQESALIKEIDRKPIFTQNSINSEYPILRTSMISSLKNQFDSYNRYKLPNPQFFEIGKIFYQENDKYIEKYSIGIYNFDFNQLKNDLQKLNFDTKIIDNNFAEIILDNLEKPKKYIPKLQNNNAYELTSQIITLDANLILDQKENEKDLIEKYSRIIGDKYLWQIIITDSFEDKKTGKFKYTFRVSYFNTDDKTAKSLHLKSFNLEKI